MCFRAFSKGEDRRIAGAHCLVHHNAAIDGETSLGGKARIRADADGHDNKIGWKLGPIFELDGANLLIP